MSTKGCAMQSAACFPQEERSVQESRYLQEYQNVMDAFLCYHHEPGLSTQLMTMEDVFAYGALNTRICWGKNVWHQSWI